MKSKNQFILGAFAIILAGFVTGAKAQGTLEGLTVEAQWLAPDTSSVYEDAGSATVNDTLEFPASAWGGNDSVNITITDTTITIDSAYDPTPGQPGTDEFTTFPFNGFGISVLSSFPGFASATVQSTAGAWSGINSSDLSFSGSSVFINMEGQPNGIGNEVVIDVTAVPEPSSVALCGLGLLAFLGVACLRRRTA